MLSVPNCEIVMICALWKGKEMGCVLIYHWVHEWDMNIWISNKQVNDFSWTGLIIVANYINIRRYQLPYFIRGLWGYSAPSCSNTLHCAYIQSSTGNLTNFALFSLLIYLQIISTIISAHFEHSHFQFNINKGNANLASNFLANLHNFVIFAQQIALMIIRFEATWLLIISNVFLSMGVFHSRNLMLLTLAMALLYISVPVSRDSEPTCLIPAPWNWCSLMEFHHHHSFFFFFFYTGMFPSFK